MTTTLPDPAPRPAPDPSRSGLLRAISVIALIAERAPLMLGVSTIARELDLPKAVAHRILKELTSVGFLAFEDDTKRYRLGPGAMNVGLAALRSLDVPRIARPHLKELVQLTGETATLSVRSGWFRVYVDQVLSPQEIRMSVSLGTLNPLHAGSSSKAILAHLVPEEAQRYIAEHTLDALTPATITDAARLRMELAAIRARGYATSLGERQAGAGSVAAPVYDAFGEVFGSISVCGPRERLEARGFEEIAGVLLHAAGQISQELGYVPRSAADEGGVVDHS